MKIWLATLLLSLPLLARGEGDIEIEAQRATREWQAAAPEDPNAPTVHWVDSSYSYANARTQALARWMDGFFGEPNYELDDAESVVRLQWTNNWDQEDDHSDNLRLRGKLQLPRISRRLNLVFSDESGDEFDLDVDENKLDDQVGLLYEVAEGERSRLDLTLGINWNRLRPGVRYRYRDTLGEFAGYRFTQRVQWDNKERFYTTSQFLLDRALNENNILRWNNKGVWGQESDGVEWVTRFSMFQRLRDSGGRREFGVSYFGAINGVTSPDSYVKNYRVGILYRRQIFRKFLFLELEPAYNYRKREPEDNREFAWSFALRLEIALERDLQRSNRNKRKSPNPGEEVNSETTVKESGDNVFEAQ